MSDSQPNRKANQLRNTINEIVGKRIDQERLNEVMIEAKKMQDIGGQFYSDAKCIMGMIAALRGNVEDCDKQYKAAIFHSGRTIEILSDYATSLWNLHQISRHFELLNELMELVPDDPELVKSALHNRCAVFDLERIYELQRKADKLKIPLDRSIEKSIESLDSVKLILDRNGATWEHLCDRIELTTSVLNGLAIHFPTVATNIFDDVILYEYNLATDVDEVIRAEEAVNEAISNCSYSPADSAMYVTCAKFK